MSVFETSAVLSIFINFCNNISSVKSIYVPGVYMFNLILIHDACSVFS